MSNTIPGSKDKRSWVPVGFVVEDTVVVELKSVNVIKDVHKKQLLTY